MSAACPERPPLDLDRLAALGVGTDLIDTRARLDGRRELAFLAALPPLVDRWQDRLELEGAEVLPGGVLSAALRCRRRADGATVVLKLSGAAAESAPAEAAALAAWDGDGACRLLWSGEQGRVMLLEAIEPGDGVAPGPEEDDVTRLAAVLERLHRPLEPPVEVPEATAELAWRFARAHAHLDGPSFARELVTHADLQRAQAAALELAATAEQRVLLHGDLIDKNLLVEHSGRWRAIDPRPCLGDPCLDAGFWALTHRHGGAEVVSRCRRLAALAGLDAERVWAWARVFAVTEAVLVLSAELALRYASLPGASTSRPIR